MLQLIFILKKDYIPRDVVFFVQVRKL